MQDVIYIVLTVVLFGALALAVRGAERLWTRRTPSDWSSPFCWRSSWSPPFSSQSAS